METKFLQTKNINTKTQNVRVRQYDLDCLPGGYSQSIRQVPEEYDEVYLDDLDEETPEPEYFGETQTQIVKRVLGILSEWEKQAGRNPKVYIDGLVGTGTNW